MFFNDRYMTEEMQAGLANKKETTCTGVMCLTPSFMEKWRPVTKTLYKERGIVNNSPSLWYSLHKFVDRPEFLSHRHQFFFMREGVPLVDENQILYGASSGKPCGIIHLNGFYGVRERYRYFPTRKYGQDIDTVCHIDESKQSIMKCKNDPSIDPMSLNIWPDQTGFSFRYRVWPWSDKDDLLQKLTGEIS